VKRSSSKSAVAGAAAASSIGNTAVLFYMFVVAQKNYTGSIQHLVIKERTKSMMTMMMTVTTTTTTTRVTRAAMRAPATIANRWRRRRPFYLHSTHPSATRMHCCFFDHSLC
jgi:hypothetical protein